MPPLRRYLRITRHTVLELRIYLDPPSSLTPWLLSPPSPALPRIIAAVRPLVLPKLREENQLSAKKGKAGKSRRGWKDVVVVEDDFEVAIFLTETSTRHSILRKEKCARGGEGRLGTTDGGMVGTRDEPVDVGEGVSEGLREGSDGQPHIQLADLPLSGDQGERAKVRRGGSAEDLFVSEGSGDEDATTRGGKRHRLDVDIGGEGEGEDEKKKMGLDTEYDGFSIYGRILCLVVKRRGAAKGKEGARQAMMEEWIASTQIGEGGMMDD